MSLYRNAYAPPLRGKMANTTDDLKRETRHLVGPRVPIREDEELRLRIDIDPEGYRALRVELFVDDDSGLVHSRGPIWVNPHALNTLSADLEL